MAREFTRSLEDVTADSDMKDVKTMVSDMKSGNFDDMALWTILSAELTSAEQDSGLSSLREDIEAVKSAGREATDAEAEKPAQDKS